MAETDDFALDAEFAAFRTGLLDQITPPGPDAVRSTVRHRRRVATTTGLALALVLVIGPVAGYATLNRNSAPPPGPATTGEPTPSPTPSATPTPSAAPSATGTPTPPDGEISRADLLKARVTLPAWQSIAPEWCVTKNVRLEDDSKLKHPALATLVHGDVDDDGAAESIALLTCPLTEGGTTQQVVVFDRDATGKVVTLGQVVRVGAGIEWLADVKYDSTGTVRVQVGDIPTCCQIPNAWSQKQWRNYGWNGKEFEQTAGPEAFGPNPVFTDLRAVSATNVVFVERPEDPVWGLRYGSVTVKIRNDGPTTSKTVRLDLLFGAGTMRHEGTGWSACTKTSNTSSLFDSNLFCELKPLKAGEERTLVLGLTNSVPQPDSGTATVRVSNIDRIDGDEFTVPDENGNNNSTEFQF
ncbi:hypothetical protein AB0J90_33720 [Micromonospora sp. NPDC049523]|uniref:hypothetical protein n=1 Tax=Micromonospora sp. NPDC049523 TaxID=3155921 RepID=UPI00341F9B12